MQTFLCLFFALICGINATTFTFTEEERQILFELGICEIKPPQNIDDLCQWRSTYKCFNTGCALDNPLNSIYTPNTYPIPAAFRNTIPSLLGSLKTLRTISFPGDGLTGSIPSELGLLENLEHLYLHDNALSGTIPSELGNCKKLERIELYNNQLSGSIPPELAASTPNMSNFQVWGNDLSGPVPAFAYASVTGEFFGCDIYPPLDSMGPNTNTGFECPYTPSITPGGCENVMNRYCGWPTCTNWTNDGNSCDTGSVLRSTEQYCRDGCSESVCCEKLTSSSTSSSSSPSTSSSSSSSSSSSKVVDQVDDVDDNDGNGEVACSKNTDCDTLMYCASSGFCESFNAAQRLVVGAVLLLQ